MTASVYDRSTQNDGVDAVLFRADRICQSAEMNELQSGLRNKLAALGDSLYKDGAIIRDAGCRVDQATGVTELDGGAVYIAGAVRGIPPATLTVQTVGTVTVGIYLSEVVQSELENPALLNPAIGTRGYGEPGALRLVRQPRWGIAGTSADDFAPVYAIDDGVLRAKEPPPNLDAVTQALARYDRDSAGGMYIVDGMQLRTVDVTQPATRQVFTLSAGRARVSGHGVEQRTDRRITYTPAPDTRTITAEPHISTTAAAQRIALDSTPVLAVDRVTIYAERTVDVVHGAIVGAIDPLPDTAILELLDVRQGATVFGPADFKLTGGRVDWSMQGAEPATGSTYKVTYRYVKTVEPSAQDSTGITVSGAVPGTVVSVDYKQLVPRIDRLCITADGELTWLRGVAAAWQPQPPAVPSGLLLLATVVQTWDASMRIERDGVVVVPMPELAKLQDRQDKLAEMLARLQLETNINTREAQAKRGMQVDPFLSDAVRDQGAVQTAAVFGGICTLPVTATASYAADDVQQPATLPFDLVPVIEQPWRTGSMRINPYDAFEPMEGWAMLAPAVDRWSNVQTQWTSPVTQIVTSTTEVGIRTEEVLVSRSVTVDKTIPVRDLAFEVRGFAPREVLAAVWFDGIAVQPTA